VFVEINAMICNHGRMCQKNPRKPNMQNTSYNPMTTGVGGSKGVFTAPVSDHPNVIRPPSPEKSEGGVLKQRGGGGPPEIGNCPMGGDNPMCRVQVRKKPFLREVCLRRKEGSR